MNKKSLILLLVLLGGFIAILSYFTDPAIKNKLDNIFQSQPSVSTLEPRVQARWNALIEEDFTQAYEFFSPSYRKLFPLNSYLSRTGTTVDWVSLKIKDIQVNGPRAEVIVKIDYRLNLPIGVGADFSNEIGQISENVNEVWLWKDGNWWYVNKDGGGLGP